MPRLHVVFAATRGRSTPSRARRSSSSATAPTGGQLPTRSGGSELVQIKSTYKDRAKKDPLHAKHDDIYAKMLSVMSRCARPRTRPS